MFAHNDDDEDKELSPQQLLEKSLLREYYENPPNIDDVAEFFSCKQGAPMPLYYIEVLDHWLQDNCGYTVKIQGRGRTTLPWYSPVQWLFDNGVSVERACKLVKKKLGLSNDVKGMETMFFRYLDNRRIPEEQKALDKLVREITDNKRS